jgi:hypothetical protein
MGPPVRVEAGLTSFSCGLGDTATLRRPPGSPRSWPGGRDKFSFGHWPASDIGGHNCGCRVAGPPDPPRGRWWVAPCRRGPRIAGRRAGRLSLPSTRLAGVKVRSVVGGCSVSKEGDG